MKRKLYLNGGSVARVLGMSSHMLLYRIRARQFPKADFKLFNERLWSAAVVEQALRDDLAEAQARLERLAQACEREAFDAATLLGDGK